MRDKCLCVALALGLGLITALLWQLSDLSTPVTAAPASRPQQTLSDVITVCLSGGCDYTTIQAAVDAASDGTVIKIASGTYTGVSARTGVTQVVYISKTVTIRGGYTTAFTDPSHPDVNPTTLDPQGRGRALYITGNISPTIEGLCITGGNAAGLGGSAWGDAGGGVYAIHATATVANILVFSNTAHCGGGMFLRLSDATLSGNTIISNTADSGGGLFLWSGTPTLKHNTIIANTANDSGGGLYLWSSAATLNRNTVTGNTAKWLGGGLSLYNSPATLSDNTIISNTAEQNGGGLHLHSSDATLVDNIVVANTANGEGGGLELDHSDAITLSGNIVISNTAERAGGGLYLHNSDAMLEDNTITANTARQAGGGMYLIASAAMLSGNTISTNTAEEGGGVHLAGGTATLNNNIIFDNQANTGSGLFIEGSSPRLQHTTFARNTDGGSSGVHITDAWWGYSTAALTNTILVSHTVGIAVTAGNTATLEATLWGTDTWANSTDWSGAGTIITGTVNIWGDPAFVGPNVKDYHIGPSSAAINAGMDAGVTTDIDGDPRLGVPDIGADEYVVRIYLPNVLKDYAP